MKRSKSRLYIADTYSGPVYCQTKRATNARNLVAGAHGGVGKVCLATKAEADKYHGKPDTKNPYPEGYYVFLIKDEAHLIQLRDTMEKSPSPRERRMGYWLNDFPRFPWLLAELLDAGKLIPIKGI